VLNPAATAAADHKIDWPYRYNLHCELNCGDKRWTKSALELADQLPVMKSLLSTDRLNAVSATSYRKDPCRIHLYYDKPSRTGFFFFFETGKKKITGQYRIAVFHSGACPRNARGA